MKQIKFHGRGGQGVVTASKILSIAVSLYEEKYAITIPAYGHERRGAPIFADIIIDDEPVLVNCFVYEPDIVIVMDEAIIEKGINIGDGAKEDAVLVLNTGKSEMAEHYRERYGFKTIFWVDATHIAVEHIGTGIPNGSILGAVAKASICSLESVEKALLEYFGKEAGEKNASAARAAYEAVKKV